MTQDEYIRRSDRYDRIEKWARRRYKRADGSWTRWVGNSIAGREAADGRAFSVPSRYSLIEDIAAAKLYGFRRAWPDFTLATAWHDPQGGEARRAIAEHRRQPR